jgi:hypothetical protein
MSTDDWDLTPLPQQGTLQLSRLAAELEMCRTTCEQQRLALSVADAKIVELRALIKQAESVGFDKSDVGEIDAMTLTINQNRAAIASLEKEFDGFRFRIDAVIRELRTTLAAQAIPIPKG